MAVVFLGTLLISLPIVFSLGAAAVTGLVVAGYPLQQLGSTLVGASQSWVLLAIPSFVFAGSIMERCGMSNARVGLAPVWGRLAPRRAGHVGYRGVVFLFRHLRLEDGRGLRLGLGAGAAAETRRLPGRGCGVAALGRARGGD